MYCIIYSSIPVKPFSDEAMDRMLNDARYRNFSSGITGMLLYDQHAFLQILEGPQKDVMEVFTSIRQDSRHFAVTVLEEREINQREFGFWSMAYADISKGIVGAHKTTVGTASSLDADAARRYLRLYRPRPASQPPSGT